MREDRRTSTSRASPASRVRLLYVDGRDWKVREEPIPYADRRAGMSLIFESISLIRRVRNYPADWFDLPDEELFQLSSGL